MMRLITNQPELPLYSNQIQISFVAILVEPGSQFSNQLYNPKNEEEARGEELV